MVTFMVIVEFLLLTTYFLQIGKEKFPGWNILREVDLNGGASTNYGTIYMEV